MSGARSKATAQSATRAISESFSMRIHPPLSRNSSLCDFLICTGAKGASSVRCFFASFCKLGKSALVFMGIASVNDSSSFAVMQFKDAKGLSEETARAISRFFTGSTIRPGSSNLPMPIAMSAIPSCTRDMHPSFVCSVISMVACSRRLFGCWSLF